MQNMKGRMPLTKVFVNRVNSLLYVPDGSVPDRYHSWYYHKGVWARTTWMGVSTQKSPADMWNYQEILATLKPSVVIEFGTAFGGSALFFASVMRQIGKRFRLLSVDVNGDRINQQLRDDPDTELLTMSSTDERVYERIARLRQDFPGPAFSILDSDHRESHVIQELKMLRGFLVSGDYVIVEDSNINGHPVNPNWGPGPFEAIEEYFRLFPGDYIHDNERESKFGFTFAPNGFLIRR